MSSNTELTQAPAAVDPGTQAVGPSPSERGLSYSRKSWNAFDAWQEHVRKHAATTGTAFPRGADRDLRRKIVAG